MAWITIAEASNVEELKGLLPSIVELPKGTKVRIEVEAFGMGPLFDSPMGNIASYLTPAGFIFKDAFGEGWSTGVIEGESDPIQLVALLWAIAALLMALGISVALIRVRVDKLPELLKPLLELPKTIAQIPTYFGEMFKAGGESLEKAATAWETFVASLQRIIPWALVAFVVYQVMKEKPKRKEGT